jgi:hypothetical protein
MDSARGCDKGSITGSQVSQAAAEETRKIGIIAIIPRQDR